MPLYDKDFFVRGGMGSGDAAKLSMLVICRQAVFVLGAGHFLRGGRASVPWRSATRDA